MPKAFITVEHITQAHVNTRNLCQKRVKAAISLCRGEKPASDSPVKSPFPLWQVTVPLSIVIVCGISAWTAYSMVEGRYLFDLSVSRDQIKVRTDVDKRQSYSAAGEEVLRGNHSPEAQVSVSHTRLKQDGR